MKKDDSVLKKQFLSKVFDLCKERFLLNDEVSLFIACQFALESDFGRSRLAVDCNNFCGMKSPEHRLSISVGSSGLFNVYSSLEQCVADYLARQNYFGIKKRDIKDIDSYSKFLRKSNYCSEPYYIDSIKAIYSNYYNYFLNYKFKS